MRKEKEPEPKYIKLYFDHLQEFQNIQFNPVLKAILKRTTNASEGQVIYTNGKVKQEIAEECHVKLNWVQAEIGRFTKKRILIKLANATYLLNPYLFGNGLWNDVKNIRCDENYFSNSDEKTK